MKSLIAKILNAVCARWIRHLQRPDFFPFTRPFTREELSAVRFYFSENGEDLAVVQLVKELGLPAGVYLDAGAFHPFRNSNTLLLAKSGWRGINIDLDAAKIAEFQKYRPNDYNLVACLSDSVREIQIAHYELSILDRVLTSEDQNELSLDGTKPKELVKAYTTTLTKVIKQSPFNLEQINYLNIDCEGHDFTVLRGLDMSRCRPQILSIETFTAEERRKISDFLESSGYRFDRLLTKTSIFVRTS